MEVDVKHIYCRTERKPSRGCVRLLNCAGLEKQGGVLRKES